MNPFLYFKLRKDKNSKLLYNVKNIVDYCIPNCFYRRKLADKLSFLKNYNELDIVNRCNYYNKIEKTYVCDDSFIKIEDFTLTKNIRPHTYFLDVYQYIRYFNGKNRLGFEFGDVTWVPESPKIVKSRPIADGNQNSVLLNLDKCRHFIFVKDKNNFEDKENLGS